MKAWDFNNDQHLAENDFKSLRTESLNVFSSEHLQQKIG